MRPRKLFGGRLPSPPAPLPQAGEGGYGCGAKGWSRRRFVAAGAAVVGGLAVGWPAPRILRAAETEKWGDLVGRLVYDGAAPERTKLKVDKDLQCCGKFDICDESLMVGHEGGLANVYVYVRDRQVAVCPDLAESVSKQVKLDNRDCIFQPHCMAIWLDRQEFFVVNSDPVAQNVAFSPLGDTPANIVMAVGAIATWKFHRAQTKPLPIACNYHPWESAYILPRNNPYTAISAIDGTFKMARLPVGRLELQVWQERVGYISTPRWNKGRVSVQIKPGVNDLGTIKLAASLFENK